MTNMNEASVSDPGEHQRFEEFMLRAETDWVSGRSTVSPDDLSQLITWSRSGVAR